MKHVSVKPSGKRLSEKSSGLRISEKQFPKPICLEKCEVKVKSGYEKFVFQTLKSFSCEELYNSKNPHDVTSMSHYIKTEIDKSKDFNAKVYSLDVKSRDDKYRLLYCFDEAHQVYKILTLCTDKTHP